MWGAELLDMYHRCELCVLKHSVHVCSIALLSNLLDPPSHVESGLTREARYQVIPTHNILQDVQMHAPL